MWSARSVWQFRRVPLRCLRNYEVDCGRRWHVRRRAIAKGFADRWSSTTEQHTGRTGCHKKFKQPVRPAQFCSDAVVRLYLDPTRVDTADCQILDFLQRYFLQLLGARFLAFRRSHVVLRSDFRSTWPNLLRVHDCSMQIASKVHGRAASDRILNVSDRALNLRARADLACDRYEAQSSTLAGSSKSAILTLIVSTIRRLVTLRWIDLPMAASGC